MTYLRNACPYLSPQYLEFLRTFRFRPKEHLKLTFTPIESPSSNADTTDANKDASRKGDLAISIAGLWLDTILYEIPLLALTSEAYFRFVDTDWNYSGQEENAYKKAQQLISNGCVFSEFGTRRRRSYHTMELIMTGLVRAEKGAASAARTNATTNTNKHDGGKSVRNGKLQGTSNVHFAMRFDILPIGTVAHEWFMGVASITNDYEHANETALGYWVACFGEGVLGIALTDTFGTPTFLNAFRQRIPPNVKDLPPRHEGEEEMSYSNIVGGDDGGRNSGGKTSSGRTNTFAEAFTGVRQDSGDPLEFVQVMKRFYEGEGLMPGSSPENEGGKKKKTIVFSDALNVEKCLKYRIEAEKAGFESSFGVGTFFTSESCLSSPSRPPFPVNLTSPYPHILFLRHVSLSPPNYELTVF